jgi:hypothetical protein
VVLDDDEFVDELSHHLGQGLDRHVLVKNRQESPVVGVQDNAAWIDP